MSPASINLSRRAVACRHWEWLPGMRSEVRTPHRRAAYRWLSGPTDERHWGLVVIVEDHRGWPARTVATLQPAPHDLPDLDDGATLGCLLGLVREAWGCHVHLRRWASPAPDMSGKDRSTWEPVDGLGRKLVAGPRVLCATEAEALVAALEAAP